MENEYKDLIEAALAIPCYLEGDTITFPGATVEVNESVPRLCGDGEAASRVNLITINIWYESRSDRNTAVETLTEALKGHGSVPEIERYYDTAAKKHRAVFNFESI